MLALRLPKEMEDRLTALSKKTGRTKSYYARQAIIEYMQDMEDYYLAEQISLDIKSGKEKTFPIEEVLKRYEMEN